MTKKTAALTAVVLFASLSCASTGGAGMKGLDPESREFLSKARYIISAKERKTLIGLPAEQRPAFIEEFWKARDPKPKTEENEFKTAYFQRIEDANLLFRQGSTPGWLQDRGRVYITLGPPDNRETYPRGRNLYGKPEEVWWYGFFPILFFDDNWTGNYRLDPLSAHQIAEITQVQAEGGATYARAPMEKLVPIDFEISAEQEGGTAVFKVMIPYRSIWLGSEGEIFGTTLDVLMEVTGTGKAKVWEERKDYKISLGKQDLADLTDETYIIEVRAEMGPGEYVLAVQVENRTGGAKARKETPFSL